MGKPSKLDKILDQYMKPPKVQTFKPGSTMGQLSDVLQNSELTKMDLKAIGTMMKKSI